MPVLEKTQHGDLLENYLFNRRYIFKCFFSIVMLFFGGICMYIYIYIRYISSGQITMTPKAE